MEIQENTNNQYLERNLSTFPTNQKEYILANGQCSSEYFSIIAVNATGSE